VRSLAHPPGEPNAQTADTPWIAALRLAAEAIGGTLVQDEAAALPPAITALVGPDVPHCLLPALRVEAALQGRDKRLIEAAIATSTFEDMALVDYLLKIEGRSRRSAHTGWMRS
jgi:hypothetical protein